MELSAFDAVVTVRGIYGLNEIGLITLILKPRKVVLCRVNKRRTRLVIPNVGGLLRLRKVTTNRLRSRRAIQRGRVVLLRPYTRFTGSLTKVIRCVIEGILG